MSGRVGWLLVGALVAEILPIWQSLSERRWVSPRLGLGVFEGHRVALLRAGVGPDRAERRTRAALARLDAERCVSLGTCGSLRDEHTVGTVLHASEIFEESRLVATLRSGEGPAIVTVREPVTDPARRQRYARFAAACEMEAAAVLRAAQGRPVEVLKVVSDMAGGDPREFAPWNLTMPLRFQLRTARLVRSRLLPKLREILQG